MRTDTEHGPVELAQRVDDVERACSLSSGATASSRSSMTMSAPSVGRLLEHAHVAAGDGQLAAVEAGVFGRVMPDSRAAASLAGQAGIEKFAWLRAIDT